MLLTIKNQNRLNSKVDYVIRIFMYTHTVYNIRNKMDVIFSIGCVLFQIPIWNVRCVMGIDFNQTISIMLYSIFRDQSNIISLCTCIFYSPDTQ